MDLKKFNWMRDETDSEIYYGSNRISGQQYYTIIEKRQQLNQN